MKTVSRLVSTLFTLLALSLVPHGHAQGIIVDQQTKGFNPILGIPITEKYYSIPSGPVGQEFVPTLSSLDFVEVFGGTLLSDGHSVNGSLFRVEIHAGSLGGPLLGTSDLAGASCCGVGQVLRAQFENPVQLTPGARYVMEFTYYYSQGTLPIGIGYLARSTYPEGRAIFAGNPVEDFALVFREGITTVPEPSTLSLLGLACVGFGVVSFRSRSGRGSSILEK